jgi:hypothetical protein
MDRHRHHEWFSFRQTAKILIAVTKPVLYIIDIIGEVVAAVDAALFPIIPGTQKHILYEAGRGSQVLKKLIQLNNATNPTTKAKKYPLVALFQDFPETSDTFYYCKVRFPKISIANFTDHEKWDNKQKYDNNFKPILYPIYREFLNQLSRHKNIVGVDFPHVKIDRPGTQPATGKDGQKDFPNFSDYVDAIEIQNLEITFKTVQFCKTILT